MRCGRCGTGRCHAHALPGGHRCERCERDWREEAPIRRSAKLIFAPPIAVLAGGVLFGVLLHLPLGAIGAAFMCAVSCVAAFGAGAGACRVVESSARAMFLRERSGSLPAARLLPAGRHRGL
ncbi:MAG TPA: hypothetical protein VGM88_18400 [Kofleriaceae bacterium]|jgi:hypothetical protein